MVSKIVEAKKLQASVEKVIDVKEVLKYGVMTTFGGRWQIKTLRITHTRTPKDRRTLSSGLINV